MLKHAMNYGIILGLLSVLLQVLAYAFDWQQSGWLTFLNYIVFAGVLLYSATYYRNHVLNGYISYGTALGTMVLTGIAGSIFVGFYMFIFYKYISPDTLDQMKILAEQQYTNMNLSREQIDKALQFISPVSLVFSAVFGYAVMSALFGLLLALFVKKQDPSILE